MVSFAVFNELSLPFNTQAEAEEGFSGFLKLLARVRNHGFTRVRVDKNFKDIQITKLDWLYGFFGKVKDRELKERLRLFLANDVIEIVAPLIEDKELEAHPEIFNPIYLYNGKKYFGGLACAEYWSTLALSFNSAPEWNYCSIVLEKDNEPIQIRHASEQHHLESHQKLFAYIEQELRLSITQKNFWGRRQELFSSIYFLDKIEREVEKLDAHAFDHFKSIMRGIETGNRPLSELDATGESMTTNSNPRLRRLRTFTHLGEELYFEKHIKNLSGGHRIHYIETPAGLLIGYVGPHLAT